MAESRGRDFTERYRELIDHYGLRASRNFPGNAHENGDVESVDPLNEWFALKVGVTRTNAPHADPQYAGRLSADNGLTRKAVLRAITLNSSYELHQDDVTGSIEVGKLADLIVLDRNFFTIPAEQIADVKVVQTIVGGRTVYDAASPAGAR